ncbi:MAG: hypothetical protein ABIJ56_11965 [Pseudomonadota bacterium]
MATRKKILPCQVMRRNPSTCRVITGQRCLVLHEQTSQPAENTKENPGMDHASSHFMKYACRKTSRKLRFLQLDTSPSGGYTTGITNGGGNMKTAISIPDSLFDDIEAFVIKAKMSRSEFFQRAAKLFLKKAAAKAITANLDEVYGKEESSEDIAFRRAALSHLKGILEDEKW